MQTLSVILQKASTKVFIISPRWGTSLKNHLFAVACRWRCNVCRFEREREREREDEVVVGVEFWEISGRREDEKMRKRGLGRFECSGITRRCGEWETGIQGDSGGTSF